MYSVSLHRVNRPPQANLTISSAALRSGVSTAYARRHFDNPPSTSGLHGERRLHFQEKEQSEILDVKGAAKYLHCSPSHVSNILNGKVPNLPPIPHVRAGRLRLIRREALAEWFKAQEAFSVEAVQKC